MTPENVESTLKWQLILSTILMTAGLIPASLWCLPAEFKFVVEGVTTITYNCDPWLIFACVASGLWSGLIIGYVTEIYTSNSYSPV